MADELTLETIHEAKLRVEGRVRRTPLHSSVTLSERLGTNAYVKLELFQKTGSFKVRGAFNKALQLTQEELDRGIVAVSGGNHAQAVAYAARTLGAKALILMPANTPQNYVDATRGYGAEIRFADSAAAAFAAVETYQREGWSYIHPFDDLQVMAGQGTVGLEIMEDLPEVTDIVISVGGGGFAGGVATAIKTLNPAVRMWGVETEGADCMSKSLAEGAIVALPAITSIARTLGAPAPSTRTFDLARQHLESITVVPDVQAAAAVRFLLERLKVLAEPAAACTLAAADRLRSYFGPECHVVLVLCGGNIGVDDLVNMAE